VSTPARKLTPAAPRHAPTHLPTPAPTPRDRARPVRAPAARPTTTSPPSPRRRARRGFHPAFWIFSAFVVTGMVVGIVSLSALLVQTGFGIDRTEARIAELADERELLGKEVATMSSPGRIASWARARGFVMPEDVVVLQVPGRPEVDG